MVYKICYVKGKKILLVIQHRTIRQNSYGRVTYENPVR